MNDLESYPPLLRQLTRRPNEFNDDPEAKLIQDKDIPIPVIDLQNMDKEKLKEACRNWGIFRLVNHGIPLSLLNQVKDISTQLFSLPFESKQTLITSPLSYFWGTPALTPSGTALPKLLNLNLVEGFNVPLNQLYDLQEHHQHPKLAPFKILVGEYGEHAARVTSALFQVMGEALTLNHETSTSEYISASTGMLRCYRYPSCFDEATGRIGMDTHNDSSVISILYEDQVGGLEFDKDGEWVRVDPLADSLIVNLGDMMQAISNDEYKSVKHRVRLNKTKARLSICYFVFPSNDFVVKSSNYKPFTYSDFQAQVQRDIITFGSKIGLDRFKIDS